MKLERFNQLLQAKYPEAEAAYDGSSKAKFYIQYRPGGKMYFYKGAIHDVAEKLELIPEVNIWKESREAAIKLMECEETFAPSGVIDTVRFMLRNDFAYEREGMIVSCDEVSKDQDDRVICRLYWNKRSW